MLRKNAIYTLIHMFAYIYGRVYMYVYQHFLIDVWRYINCSNAANQKANINVCKYIYI